MSTLGFHREHVKNASTHVLQELSKISGAPRAQPVFAHSSTSSPGNPPATIAAPGSTVHPHRILPDYAATPMLDAPAQPVPQMQMVDLSNNAA